MSVEFDPVRVRRRRRFDPLLVIVPVVILAVVIAIAKPWDAGEGSSIAQASPAASASAGAAAAEASPSRPPTPRTSPSPIAGEGPPLPSWSELADVVGSHHEWGVLAVTGRVDRFTASGVDAGFAASWVPAGVAADVVGPNPDVRSGEADVIGLGVTFPRNDAPRDIRVWLQRNGGGPEWIDVVPVPGRAADDPMVVMRLTPSGAVEPFEAGHYRLDLLGKGSIDRIAVGIPDSTGSVPDPSPWPITETRLVPAAQSDPSAVRSGLFATVDGFAVSLPATPDPPLDEVDAWEATEPTPGARAAPAVATAFMPRATGLGVVLTSHGSVELADLSRLAPTPLVPVPPVRRGISDSRGGTPYVIFEGPQGRPLKPGVYALSVSWTDASGLHAGTWHVELRPGPVHD
jgi:hypothetical protein